MKHILIFAVLILGGLSVQAATDAEFETFNITWSKVKTLVENNPDSIKTLINRVIECDNTLEPEELLIAYMGNSYFVGNSLANESGDVNKALRDGNIDQAMALIEEVIDRNPLSLTNNYTYYACAMRKNPQIKDINGNDVDEKLKQAVNRSKLLFKAIYFSGNGSQQFPFKVTSIDDEYTFMRQGLELPRPTNQSLTEDGHDLFELPDHTSKRFTGREIHFDASRILEIEMEMFNRP